MTNLMNNKKPLPGIIHLAGWGILFGLPFFFAGHEQDSLTLERYVRFIIPPISFMMVFYINYFLLVDRYLFNRKTTKFILINIVIIALTFGSVDLLMRGLNYFFPRPAHEFFLKRFRSPQDVFFFISGNLTTYVLVAGLSVAIKMTNGWYKIEGIRNELERSRAEAELSNLKSQLNPHFLFNTLNNIYSLIAFSPEKAQEAVHDLSRLLRYVLYDSSQPLVPLEKDLDFLRNYVELMRIRLSGLVKLDINIQSDSLGLLIAPLLFISLVENAFKHGISNSQPSFVQLDIHAEETCVICHIRNSYFPKDPNQDKSGSGIGLMNLQKRLELIYPQSYTFKQGMVDNNIYYTELIINTKTEEL